MLLVSALVLATRGWSAAAFQPGSLARVERAGLTMGSEVRLTAWTADVARANAAFDEVFAEFERLDRLMSVWREGSDVLRVNAAAGAHAVPVSTDTRAVLHSAVQISEWTGGKFDVTFGALTDVWKFDHDLDGSVPSAAQISARLPLIDYRAIVIDDDAGTVMLRKKGMHIHLGGIGKGYAVEKSVRLLRARGLSNFMIQAGGDLYVAGKRGDRPWRLGIADPRGNHDPFATVELADRTLSTSGDYERFFFKDGRRYHHILDPADGQPARASRSVTLVSESPTIADGVAKGVFILGPSAGMALIERLHLEGVIVGARNEVVVSPGLRGSLTWLHQPTDAP